jgi:hypothetical protein
MALGPARLAKLKSSAAPAETAAELMFQRAV